MSLRVLILVRELATGTLTYTENIVNGLSGRGVEVMLAYTGAKPSRPARPMQKADHGVPAAMDSKSVTQVFRFLFVLRSLKRQVARFRPHIIFTQGLDENGFIASLASFVFSTPAVSFVHDLTLEELLLNRPKHHTLLYGLSLARQRLTSRRLSAVLVGSDFMRASITHMFGIPVKLTRLGVKMGPAEMRMKPEAAPFRIIFVGNLASKKRPDTPIRAVAALKELDLRLVLVGEGRERESLLKLCGQLGVADRVEFRGRLSDDELARELSVSNLCLVPSLWEGFGLAAVEAMSHGVPVIASESGGLRELVTSGVNGFLVPLGSDGLWQECVRRLYENRGLLRKLSDNAYESSKGYNWDTTAQQTLDVFKELLTVKGSS